MQSLHADLRQPRIELYNGVAMLRHVFKTGGDSKYFKSRHPVNSMRGSRFADVPLHQSLMKEISERHETAERVGELLQAPREIAESREELRQEPHATLHGAPEFQGGGDLSLLIIPGIYFAKAIFDTAAKADFASYAVAVGNSYPTGTYLL